MEKRKASSAVIKRMPRYYRLLSILKENGIESVSSKTLGNSLGLTASQVRQDFNCFGGFGQQGYGYKVEKLITEIRSILAIDREYTVVIVGAGNIGRAITHFEGFAREGIKILALFDIDTKLVGSMIDGKPIYNVSDLGKFISDNNVDIGVIAAQKSEAQQLAESMACSGIRGIWNFAPVEIVVDVPVENVHFLDSMITLTYKIEREVGKSTLKQR